MRETLPPWCFPWREINAGGRVRAIESAKREEKAASVFVFHVSRDMRRIDKQIDRSFSNTLQI